MTGKPLGDDHRNIITHLDHVRIVDYPRMKRLGLLGQIQPQWMGFDEYDRTVTLPNVGAERYADKNQYSRLVDFGIRFGAGADWPTGPVVSPWDMIQIGTTSQELDQADPPRVKPLSVERLIRAFTIDGAFLQFRDHISGSIEVGKRADLIVIDRNILEIPKDEISKTRVLLTMLDGQPVYGATNFKDVRPAFVPISFRDESCVFCGQFPPRALWKLREKAPR